MMIYVQCITVKFTQSCVQTYRYQKPSVLDDSEGKEQLASKLLAFGVSLKEFMATLSQDEITQSVVIMSKALHSLTEYYLDTHLYTELLWNIERGHR